jgi:hypothetical protein
MCIPRASKTSPIWRRFEKGNESPADNRPKDPRRIAPNKGTAQLKLSESQRNEFDQCDTSERETFIPDHFVEASRLMLDRLKLLADKRDEPVIRCFRCL